MQSFDRIMLAVDLRQGTQDVLDAGAYLASQFDSEIVLFHAIPEVKGSPIPLQDLRVEAENLLDQARSGILQGRSFRIRTAVDIGPPVRSINEAAHRYDVDAIVMGSGTKEPGERFQLGFTAEQIMRYSNRPVLLIKAGQALRIDAILCPVDFSDHSSLALEHALSLARAFNAKLAVVNVVEDISNVYPGRPVLEPQTIGSYTEEQKAEFDRFLSSFDFEGVTAEKLLLLGKPHEEILKLVRDRGCHLIVMGSEGRTGFVRLIMGSVAEKVIREVPCTVLTVKNKAAQP